MLKLTSGLTLMTVINPMTMLNMKIMLEIITTIPTRKRIFVDTVSTNKNYAVDTVSTNKNYAVDTVSTNKNYAVDTVSTNKNYIVDTLSALCTKSAFSTKFSFGQKQSALLVSTV